MCGIVGYAGRRQAAPLLLEGLSKLEYRGYDSAGIAVMTEGGIAVKKSKGRLSVLNAALDGGKSLSGFMGIAHTRWATHGEPSDINSHPHLSQSGMFAVVHNGIIENCIKLRAYLSQKGFSFVSETDTEVIAHLLEYYYDGDIIATVNNVLSKVEGSYALGILCADNPDSFVAVRRECPLIVGLGEGENFIASDIPAILNQTRKIYFLENNEIALLSADNVKIFNSDMEEVKKSAYNVDWDIGAAEKGGYEHFMFKEIAKQPHAVSDTVKPRIKDGSVIIDNISISDEYLKDVVRIHIIACGSSYNAGVVGKYVLENLTRLPVDVSAASEFLYSAPIIGGNTLVIVISQSGETADTIAAMREAKRLGGRTLAIVNAVGSTVAREADDVLYTWAGPETAVASTKAYSAQLAAIYILAIYISESLSLIDAAKLSAYLKALGELPGNIERLLKNKGEIQYLASKYHDSKNVLFIGASLDYAVALEGSHKLKEISYIHSDVCAAGELRHGTIALIEEGTVAVVLCTVDSLFGKMLDTIKDIKARDAVVIAVAEEGRTELLREADHVIFLPKCNPLVMPSESIIPLQLFAYYIASLKGLDIDKPRSLVKSVTDE